MNPAGQPSADWLALPSEERARTFQAKPLWQRAIVVAAGPITNFLIAILILAGFALAYGESRTPATVGRSEEHTSELQSLMRISYAVFCLTKKNTKNKYNASRHHA